MSQSSPKRVGIKKGTFYLSENEPQGEGWKKQEFKNPQTGEDMIKYHKDVTIEGNLVYVGLKEDKFKGNCLSLMVKNSDDLTYSLEVPIKDTKGVKATNDYFNSLVGALEQLKKGDYIKMFINNKNEDKKGNLYKNVVTLDSEGKLVKSGFQFSEVPKWKVSKTTDEFEKEVTVYDPLPTNAFYISKFMDIVVKFKGTPAAESDQTNTPREEAPKNALPPKTAAQAFAPATAESLEAKFIPGEEYEDDDLPF